MQICYTLQEKLLNLKSLKRGFMEKKIKKKCIILILNHLAILIQK